jgi:integrase
MVRDYILHLRDNSSRRLARKSINVHLAAISHFLYMIRDDDYKIDWKKVRLEIPPDENIRRDRSYTIEEIQKMLSACSRTRDKAIIYLLTSTGMRIGAVHTLKVGDLSPKETNQGRVYRIEVYSGSSDSYYCYCNIETTQILDEYLKERTDAGEVLRNDSPLIRHLYTSISIKAPVKKVSDPQIKYIVGRIVKLSGIKNTFQFTGEAKRGKGFRKYYKTTAELAGMKPINVEITHGHSIGMSGHYYTPSESDVLKDYMTYAADALTVSQAYRQEKRIEELETERTEEIARLKTQIDKMKENHSEVLTLKAQFDEMKQKIDRIDLVDLQTFPSDYTIRNLLADHGIDYKEQRQNKADSKKSTNNSK